MHDGVCVNCGLLGCIQARRLCTKCYQREYRSRNPEKQGEYQKHYHARYPDRARERQLRYLSQHGDEVRRRANDKTRRLRAEVVVAYGGQCECCGEAESVFLTVDHVNNDGRKDRASDHGGWRFYTRLKKLGFPKDGYRLLCFNCNLARGFFGKCPHEGRA